jgi:hypothetical protein
MSELRASSSMGRVKNAQKERFCWHSLQQATAAAAVLGEMECSEVRALNVCLLRFMSEEKFKENGKSFPSRGAKPSQNALLLFTSFVLVFGICVPLLPDACIHKVHAT